MNHALREIRQWILDERIESIAHVLTTCVGGLDWADVKPLFKTHLSDRDARVFVGTK